jgi:hypothetical protein
MWPFLHINKHNIRTWTEVNEWKTLAEIKMMYNLRENTQRTFQVGSRFPMVTNGC